MLKSLLIGTVLCISFIAPDYASSQCEAIARTALETTIKAMPEGPNKVAALKSWDLSTEAMKANKMDDCDSNMKDAADSAAKTN